MYGCVRASLPVFVSGVEWLVDWVTCRFRNAWVDVRVQYSGYYAVMWDQSVDVPMQPVRSSPNAILTLWLDALDVCVCVCVLRDWFM